MSIDKENERNEKAQIAFERGQESKDKAKLHATQQWQMQTEQQYRHAEQQIVKDNKALIGADQISHIEAVALENEKEKAEVDEQK